MMHQKRSSSHHCFSTRAILYKTWPICRLCIFLLPILTLMHCQKKQESILAIIGDRAITVSDFQSRYQEIKNKMNLPDNGQVRSQTFQNMIDEELMIEEAIQRGFDADSTGKYEKERLKIQSLLDAYLKQVVIKDIRIEEDELKTLYVRLNTRVKARHLYAESREQADSIRAELMQGKSFEELASDIYKDPQLRDTGGNVGYFTVDEMDPYFEEAAYTLGIGEISKPVRTAQGYSIIQVQKHVTKPLLTESEYVKHRANLEEYWRMRKIKTASRDYVDSMRKALDVLFNDEVVSAVLESLSKRTPVLNPGEDATPTPQNNELNDKVLVYSNLGDWTVEKFLSFAKYSSEEQLQWIGNQENLEDFIAGIVVRAHSLAKAEAIDLHRSESFQNHMRQKMDDFLLTRMEASLFDDVTIPEDTLRAYYHNHQQQFIRPPSVRLAEIVLDDESMIPTIRKKLNENVPFAKLAKAYSVNRRSAERDGEIGSFAYQDLGPHAERIFQLKQGKWKGPIKVNDQFAFIKCLGKQFHRTISFEEARSEIVAILNSAWKSKAKNVLLTTLREKVKIVTYPEKLKSIQII
ncbi:peptidylprolyl isomerase [candidate division KSB1 bacterium]|nr:peptidylprolyl isomerase [candidate division KSB1 bacterium]